MTEPQPSADQGTGARPEGGEAPGQLPARPGSLWASQDSQDLATHRAGPVLPGLGRHRLRLDVLGAPACRRALERNLFLFGWTLSLNKGPGVQLWQLTSSPCHGPKSGEDLGEEAPSGREKGATWHPHTPPCKYRQA